MKLRNFLEFASSGQLGPSECLVFLRMASGASCFSVTTDQLSEALGWSRSKTWKSIQLLLEKGVVSESQTETFLKGRPKKTYRLTGSFGRLSCPYVSGSTRFSALGESLGVRRSLDELLLTVAILDRLPSTNYWCFDGRLVKALGLESRVVQSSLVNLVKVGWLQRMPAFNAVSGCDSKIQTYSINPYKLAKRARQECALVDASLPDLFNPEGWCTNGIPQLLLAAECLSLFVELFNEGVRGSRQFVTEVEKRLVSRVVAVSSLLQDDAGVDQFGELVKRELGQEQFLALVACWVGNAISLEQLGATKLRMAIPHDSTANLLVFDSTVSE